MKELPKIPNDRYGWREWPLVVLSFKIPHTLARKRIVALARELSWRVLDLSHYKHQLPSGVTPQGAIVDHLWDTPLVQDLQRHGSPIVRLGRFVNPYDDVLPAVLEDYAMAGRMAAEHFAERGFRHVGFVGYAPMIDYGPLYDALRARAGELGMSSHLLQFQPLEPFNFTDLEKVQRREREFIDWIHQTPKPLGLLGASDDRAARFCAVCLEAGVAVPNKVAILGRGGDNEICECAPVPLSTVDQGGERHGEIAVQILKDLMAGKAAPKSAVLVPPRAVMVRESTDTLATADATVLRALRFLWDHLDQNLAVNDVAIAAGVSRRTLERAFQEQIGHGVATELNRRRLERCCELLRETQLSVTDIAPYIGFRSKDYLHSVFRRTYGITPRKYRLMKTQ